MAHWHIGSFCIDGRYIQDHFPGIGRYTYNLIDALARVAPDDRFVVLHNPALKNSRYDIAALARHPNVKLCRVDAPTFSLREQFELLTFNFELVHSPYFIKPYFLRIPSVVTIFDLIPLLFPNDVPSTRARFFFRWAVWLAAQTATRVIVPSVATRDDLVERLRVPRAKIVVVPLAADARFVPQSGAAIARVREKYALPERYVLYVGINKPHKNLAVLMDAWARVETDAALVIAGAWDARYTVDSEQEAGGGRQGSRGAGEQSEIENRKSKIRFVHDVDDADLPALYAGSTVFVMPSLYEGFGLTPLEAMASGAPVICSHASSLPEVVGDAALMVNPRDADEIARALARVLDDAALRDDLRAKSLARAAQFSWERAARETMEV
ncbi:MAG: glycosyltransferase family 4 protein, partial [Anaerolineales bacterium]|nr:glycosyltransferase family 4 protein [Anaerolineales bacterium]